MKWCVKVAVSQERGKTAPAHSKCMPFLTTGTGKNPATKANGMFINDQL